MIHLLFELSLGWRNATNHLETRNTFWLQKWKLIRVLAFRKLNTAKPLVTPSSFVFFKLHSACLRLLLSSISSVFSLLKASSLSSSFEFSPHLYKKIVSRVTVVVESCWRPIPSQRQLEKPELHPCRKFTFPRLQRTAQKTGLGVTLWMLRSHIKWIFFKWKCQCDLSIFIS